MLAAEQLLERTELLQEERPKETKRDQKRLKSLKSLRIFLSVFQTGSGADPPHPRRQRWEESGPPHVWVRQWRTADDAFECFRSASKALSRSGKTAPIVPAARPIGSR